MNCNIKMIMLLLVFFGVNTYALDEAPAHAPVPGPRRMQNHKECGTNSMPNPSCPAYNTKTERISFIFYRTKADEEIVDIHTNYIIDWRGFVVLSVLMIIVLVVTGINIYIYCRKPKVEYELVM
eukprot:UN09717